MDTGINQLITIGSLVLLSIGLMAMFVGGFVHTSGGINSIIYGAGLVGGGTLLLLCTHFSQANNTISAAQGAAASAKAIAGIFMRFAPFLAIVAMAGWIVFMFVTHTSALASNNVATMFYTYYFVSFMCLLMETAAVAQISIQPDAAKSGDKSGDKSNDASLFSAIALFFVSLNIISNIIMQIILTNYQTQG